MVKLRIFITNLILPYLIKIVLLTLLELLCYVRIIMLFLFVSIVKWPESDLPGYVRSVFLVCLLFVLGKVMLLL